jgi:DMSO/TMAO reductase YedYZ molybdopterin-dependent catalytic subunit
VTSPRLTRRALLHGSLGLFSGTFTFGCADRAPFAPRDATLDDLPDALHPADVNLAADVAAATTPSCSPELVGGFREAVAQLLPAPTLLLDELVGEGLDGRLYTDLARLDERTLALPTERFYVRTRASSLLDTTRPWRVAFGGLFTAPRELTIESLLARSVDQGEVLLECSGNGSGGAFGLLGAARWEGVPLHALVAEAAPPSQPTRVLVSGFDAYPTPSARSTPGASWVFSHEQLRATGAFLATRMNGAPLPRDHGAPVRLVVPNWYGCTCIKWVDAVTLVADDAPATAHMTEFASRTMQVGKPLLARDFQPAEIDPAAMPIRVERWRVGGVVRYRTVGLRWGGAADDALEIQYNRDLPWLPVAVCRPRATARTWGAWEHVFRPPGAGRYTIALRTADRRVQARRLDAGFYARALDVPAG